MITSKNVDLLQPYLDTDIRLMTDYQKTIVGDRNCIMYYNSLIQKLNITGYKRNKIEVLDIGSQLIEIGQFVMSIEVASKSEDIRAKYMDIWKRNNDNSWTLETQIWNYDHWVELSEHLHISGIEGITPALLARQPVVDNVSFEIAALNALLEKTIVRRDARQWAMFYDDKGKRLGSFSPLTSGAANLAAFFKKHASELAFFDSLDIRTEKIEQIDNYVIEYASALVSWYNDSTSGVSTSKNVRVWKRQKNGTLKMLYLIACYD